MGEQQLLIDCVGYATMSLNENAKVVNGALKFRGKFQEGDVENKNHRIYPRSVLSINVDRLSETIKNRGLIGELDHPTDSIIHFENSSHLITKLYWEGNVLMGEGEVLNTPQGKLLRSLIEAGVRVGISSRGVGNGQPNEDGVLVIGESYKLITFDAVADPSCYAAFQERIVGNETTVVIHNQPQTKTESVVQHKVNAKALVSFLGTLFETKTAEIKNKLHQ